MGKQELRQRVGLVLRLMEYRAIDVKDFTERVYAELETWREWDDDASGTFNRWFSAFRDGLDDVDCAIIDVLLAKGLADARSIVGGFRP
jgi:hypothetical protein